MNSLFSKKFPSQTVIASVVVFMLLNAFFPLDFSLKAEATGYPFKLTTKLEKTAYKLREPVNVTFLLQNIANEVVTVEHPSPFDFIVHDAKFTFVYRYGEWHGWILDWHPPEEIEPGEALNFTLTWYQEVGFERIRLGVYNYYWARPGTYYIIGIFSSYTYSLKLVTPAIKLRIVG